MKCDKMLKYRVFQFLMAVAVFLLITSSAVSLAFAFRDTGQEAYINNTSTATATAGDAQMTKFDAWLEYSIISDGMDADGDDSFSGGTAYICEYNLYRLNQIKTAYKEAKRTVFFSIIMMLICFLVVKRRRLYECIVWGGAAGAGLGVLTFVLLFFSRSGFFYGIKEMVFHENYSIFFSTEDDLIALIPDNMALRMFLIYGVSIVAGLLITIIVRYISRRKSKPYRF